MVTYIAWSTQRICPNQPGEAVEAVKVCVTEAALKCSGKAAEHRECR